MVQKNISESLHIEKAIGSLVTKEGKYIGVVISVEPYPLHTLAFGRPNT